jgi:hypothetical protein
MLSRVEAAVENLMVGLVHGPERTFLPWQVSKAGSAFVKDAVQAGCERGSEHPRLNEFLKECCG